MTIPSELLSRCEDVTTLTLPGFRGFRGFRGQPLSIVHITDVHLCECDERDADLLEFMRQRMIRFYGAPQMLFYRLLHDCLQKGCDFIAFTGDMYDTITQANIDTLEAIFRRVKVPWGLIGGCHEWYGRKGETREQIYQRLGPLM